MTVSTYQIMTYRKCRDAEFEHMKLFDERDWGLIFYDEVHLLPAPVFLVTAGLQARRRLGLTSTLVRQDEREDDVFALIGPKKTDVPCKAADYPTPLPELAGRRPGADRRTTGWSCAP